MKRTLNAQELVLTEAQQYPQEDYSENTEYIRLEDGLVSMEIIRYFESQELLSVDTIYYHYF